METIRVLYIEDDDQQRKTFTKLLRSKGFITTAAKSGKTGLGFFKSRVIDVILCDLNMPKMNGLEVLKKVRQKDNKTPFILMTAHGTVSLAVKAIKKGASHFILKPASIDQIDITIRQTYEKARLEQKLKDSRETLRLVSENVPDVIYSLNLKGEFISLSPAIEGCLGYKPSELIGASVFNIIFSEDKKRVAESFMKSIKTGEAKVKMLQFRMVSKAGEVKHFEISRKLIFENGQVLRSDGIARDISERIKLENKLKEYSHQLEEKVAERTTSLEYANQQLAALNKASAIFNRIYKEDKLFETAPEILTSTLDFDSAYLLMEDDNRLLFKSWCCRDTSSKQIEKYIKKVNKGLAKLPPHLEQSFKQKKTIFVRNLKADRRWPKNLIFMARAKSMVISPIKLKSKVVGVIAGFMDKPERDMNKQDVHRFVMFANIVSLALDNIQTYQSLERKVAKRTETLKIANDQLKEKTQVIEKSQLELAKANVELLKTTEQLEIKNEEMERLLKRFSEGKDQLQAILDSSPSGMFMVNKEDKVIATNQSIKMLFGLEPTKVIHNNIREIHKKIRKRFEDKAKFDKLLKKLRSQPDKHADEGVNPHIVIERALKTADTAARYIAIFSIAVLDKSGDEFGRLWIYVDISAMKQADEQLHTIVEASPIPTIISRIKDGKVIYANERLANLIEAPFEKVLDSYTPDYYYDSNDRKTIIESLMRYGYVRNIEVRLKKYDGEPIWTSLSLIVTEIGGEKVILGGISDISEIKKAEEALTKERNFVSAVLDTAGALVLVLDKEGRIVRFNKASKETTGYDFSEVKGKYVWDMFIASEELEEIKSIFKNLRSGDFPTTHENYFITKSGSKRLIAWSNTALTDDKGDVEFIIATGIDITKRKEAENKLKLYKEVFMNTSDGIVIVGPQGKIIDRNPAHRKYFGYTDEELYGMSPNILLGESRLEDFHNIIAERRSFQGEIELRTKQGIKVDVDLTLFPIFDDSGELICFTGMGRDITERKKAEEKLKLYKKIFLNTTDGIMILDPNGVIVERNPAQRHHSGLSYEELIGKNIAAYLGQESFAKISDSIKNNKSFRGELQHHRSDGIYKTMDISVFPIKNTDGEVVNYIGIGRDITERIKAEKAMEVRLRYEETLAKCSQTLLSESDVKDALNKALGYLLKAADTGRVYIFENFEDEADGLCARQTHEICTKGVEPQIDFPYFQHAPYKDGFKDFRNILEDGEIINANLDSLPVNLQELLQSQSVLSVLIIPITVENKWFGFIGFDELKEKKTWSDEDVRMMQTASEMIGIYIEKKRFEEVLRLSEERFRSLVENANDIIYSLSPQGRFTYVSPTADEILGYRTSDLIGKSPFDLMHQEDRKDSSGWPDNIIYKSQLKWADIRFRLKHKDGSYRWFVSNSSIILDENKKVVEIIGIAHDITQMKKALDDLEKANQHLKETQSQLAQSEKMASLGTLVAGIAHEINTPIGAVNSMHNTLVRSIEKLKGIITSQLSDELLKTPDYINTIKIIDDSKKVIKEGSDRVINIVKRLRSFARLDEAELKTVNIHEGIEDTLVLIHHDLKHGIKVIKNFGDIPHVACYPGQLNQVFLNILVNARQAMKGKGEINITTFAKKNKIFIEFTDNGTGIPKEQLSKIFDPGFTTKGVGVGTGLGLSICYQIMQDHKGEIKVRSELGKGTTFTIILPLDLQYTPEKDKDI